MAAFTGVAHNHRQGKMRCVYFGDWCAVVTQTVNAETKTIAGRIMDRTGPGSTKMKTDRLINAIEAMTRRVER